MSLSGIPMTIDNAQYESKRSDAKHDPKHCNASTSETVETSSGEGMFATPYALSTHVLDDVAVRMIP